MGVLTQSLDAECLYICTDEDARVPYRPDERDVLAPCESNRSAQHHVGCCCKEQGSDEEECALNYERRPGGVVMVGADAGCETGYFACREC